MLLSPAERSFLYDSLKQDHPIRPDARSVYQYRPLEAKTDFLEGSNGSSRMRLVDGSECIVSVKAKVVPVRQVKSLIEVDIDVSKFRDDSNFASNLKFNLTSLLESNFPVECLQLTSKYAFKLYIDCIVISHFSHPLSLISLTTYLALKTTKLPLLVSEINDEDIEEQPTFSDDWSQARSLADVFQTTELTPPIFVTLGVVGGNLFFDPSLEEEQVLENGIIVGFHNKSTITPLIMSNLASNSNNANFKGLDRKLISKTVDMCNKYCVYIIQALNNLVEQDKHNDGTIF